MAQLAPFEQFDHSDVAAILDSDTVASASQESEESEEATDDEEKEKDKERKKQEEEEKKKDRELLLAVWTLNPDGMDFLGAQPLATMLRLRPISSLMFPENRPRVERRNLGRGRATVLWSRCVSS